MVSSATEQREVKSKNPELWRLDDEELAMLERYWTQRLEAIRAEKERRDAE